MLARSLVYFLFHQFTHLEDFRELHPFKFSFELHSKTNLLIMPFQFHKRKLFLYMYVSHFPFCLILVACFIVSRQNHVVKS